LTNLSRWRKLQGQFLRRVVDASRQHRECKQVIKLLHRTSLERAVKIMEEGFYPRQNGLAIERGANFHSVDAVNEANETHSGCDLIFNWAGLVSDNPGDNLDHNVLYRYGSWKFFIRDCTNENLIFDGFQIDEDGYKKYDATVLEKIKHGFSGKKACEAFFSQYLGRPVSVNSAEQ
jgi:hypothetical protein